ncbi:uncharacterized protein LOC114318232 [Camellia sinensis]|uniref:uncharacterized protein LOC114318232 n=1 Tax=Camellia sinensis TaxID=4442 RepID=UPI001036D24A|nr:uncharacterized protein LOC114318232 [Camellia sinensis]
MGTTNGYVGGYYGRLQPGTRLEAELWALYKGLTIILQKGLSNVTIEISATHVVQLMEDESGDKCPFKNMVEDAETLLRGCNYAIQHVWKERNLCVDAMAKFGAAQLEDIIVVNEPPVKIKSQLVADMVGMSRERA